MVDRDIAAAYAGARVTDLVNRSDILHDILDAIGDSSGRTYVFYLEAPGGTGKTFLAREVLRRCQENGEWARPELLAARHEVDLYHHQARSVEGFMATFAEAFEGEQHAFASYREQRERLPQATQDYYGAISDQKAWRRQLRQGFLEDCQALGATKRVVAVLDTAEKLTYETDRVERELQLSRKTLKLRPWLLDDWLPAMRNAVILVCGRPRGVISDTFPADLRAATQAHPGMEYRAPKLHDFDEDETLEYIRAVRKTAQDDGNTRAMSRLDAISEDRRRAMYYLTGGHPITLALMIDYYLVTEQLLPEVKTPLSKLKAMSRKALKELRERVKIDIVRVFQEIGRPANDAIVNLAWAPMGMDAELLGRVADMPPAQAKGILDTLADERSGVSFVKIRRPDRRAFLHDEMYALMQAHVLSGLQDRGKEVYAKIRAYYAKEIKAQEQQVESLHSQAGGITAAGHQILGQTGQVTSDPQVLADTLAGLDDLRFEEVYYLLQADPLAGFEQYCEYAQAAVMSHNDSLDMQLRDLMLVFMREKFGEAGEWRGLRRDAVERDSTLRWGWRFVYEAQPVEALDLVRYLREREPGFIEAGDTLSLAELEAIEGWAKAFLGEDLAAAEVRLKKAVETLSRFKPASDFEQGRRNVLLAQAYHVLGYVLRVQARYQAACDSYRAALLLWRELGREADHAEALNNLAFAYAETGNFRRALRYCENGLELRERLRYRYLAALSLNTLGLIEIKNDQPHRGMVHCEQALAIFSELEMPRGVGLACTALAEAYRRSAAARRLYPPPEQVRRLREAERFALQAVQIFGQEVHERLRLAEALNELGCVYRNWSTVWGRFHTEQDPDRDTLVSKGIEALEEAGHQAAGAFFYRQVDALVNLAWLHFYNDRKDQPTQALVEGTLDRAQKIIEPKYLIDRDRGLPKLEGEISFLWTQLAKMHLLRGEMAMRDYRNVESPGKGLVRDQRLLEKAMEQFTLALAYSELFNDDYRDIRRAKDSIYDEIRDANVEELRAMHRAIRETAIAYNLECRPADPLRPARPRMRNFLEENFGTPLEPQVPMG